MADADWRQIARQAARRYGLDPSIFERQINQESGGRDVRSPAGAQGPGQFMPGTARSVGLNDTTVHQLGPSLNAAAKLMSGYVKKYGSYRDALVAYNAGPGRVGGSLPAETRHYIQTILGGRNPKGLGGGGRSPAALLGAAGGDVLGGDSGMSEPMGAAQGSEGALALIQALQHPQAQPVASGALSMPAASAAPPLPQGYQAPSSGGGPAPKLDMDALISAAETVGQETTVPQEDPAGVDFGAGGSVGAGSTRGGSRISAGGGRVVLDPSADRPGVRTHRAVLDFAGQVSAIAGMPVRIGTGTRHSRLTVNGNVSEHWGGNAGDIPATGNRLITLGRAALIAAGMPEREARRQTGGLFNVRGFQIIFNTHEGGDHTNHLHVGVGRARGRR